MNTGGPAFPLTASTGDPRDGVYCQNGMTMLDWMAGQSLAGLCSSWYDRYNDDPETQRGYGPMRISQSAYTHAEAMLAEKARREAGHSEDTLGKVPDHSPDAGKMVWKQSPRTSSAVVCETQFSDRHSDNSNVRAYGGFLVAESVPPEAMDLIVRAPKLEAMNRELVEALHNIIIHPCPAYTRQAEAILAKAKGVA